MTNSIKEIYSWQKKAGNLDREYDDFLESAFQVEEALEGFPQAGLNELAEQLSEEHYEPHIPQPKELSRAIIHTAKHDYLGDVVPVADVDRLDKACDAIVYAIGSMGKLGLTPQQINEALLIVNRANLQKLGMPRDEQGKLLKPDDFKGPEPELEALLEKRGR